MTKKFNSFYLTLLVVLTGALIAAPAVSVHAMSSESVTPDDDLAGVTTTYTVEFNPDNSTGVSYIVIDFSNAADASGASLVSTNNIASDVTLDSAGTDEVVLVIGSSKTTGSEDLSSTDVDVTLDGIVNSSTPADYTANIDTYNTGQGVIESGSATVTIKEVPDHFEVTINGGGTTVTAGSEFSLDIAAKTSGGDTIADFDGEYRIDFSSNTPGKIPSFVENVNFTSGDVTGVGAFELTETTETATITASHHEVAVAGTTADITVNPAALDYFELSGLPSSVTAGENFTSDVTVTPYDKYGNVKTDYSEALDADLEWGAPDGSVSEGSGLPSEGAGSITDGVITYDAEDFYLEDVVEDGQTLTFTDTNASPNISVTSDAITVNPAEADSMSVSISTDHISADGEDTTTVTASVTDAYDNDATGYTGSVTFESDLGSFDSMDSNFSDGTAEAVLSSTVAGTADILVTSGNFQDSTETVTIGNEIWVDRVDGASGNPGTEMRPLDTIQNGIETVTEGGTVYVQYKGPTAGDGSYDAVDFSTASAAADLTVEGVGAEMPLVSDSGGPAVNITHGDGDITLVGLEIDADDNSTGDTVHNTGGELTIEDSKIHAANNSAGYYGLKSNNTVDVSNTTFVGTADADSGGSDGAGFAVSLSNSSDAGTFSNTTFKQLDVGIQSDDGSNLTIEKSVFKDIYAEAVIVRAQSGITVDTVTVQENDFRRVGQGVYFMEGGTIEGDLLVNDNNFYSLATSYSDNNAVATAGSDGTWDGSGTISGTVDATDNWWTDVGGPGVTDAVSTDTGTDISYSSWLDAPYPNGWSISTVGSSDALSMEIAKGWQMFSVPFKPANPTASQVFDADNSTPYDTNDSNRYSSVFYYNVEAGEYVGGTDIDPVRPIKGLWMYSANEVPATTSGNPYSLGSGYRVESDVDFDLEVADWYMISAPFNVYWGDVEVEYDGTVQSVEEAAVDDWMSGKLWTWDMENEEYVSSVAPDGMVQADKGYWIKTKVDNLKVDMPFNPSSKPAAAGMSLSEMGFTPAKASAETPPTPPAAPQEAAEGLKATAAMSNGTVNFEVAGADVQSMQVQVFSADGSEVFAKSAQGSSLSWDAEVANGVYLYGVTAQVDGETKPLGIQKLLVLE